jgi:hypothetical protein
MTEEFQRPEPKPSIEDHGNGVYTLHVDGSPVAKIDWLYGQRICRWQVHGYVDLDRAVALMNGFLHLTALLGNENRASLSPPAALEKDSTPKGKRHGKTERQSRSAGSRGRRN